MGEMREKILIAAWASPTTAGRLKAMAQLCGTSQSAVLRLLVDAAAERMAMVNPDPPDPINRGQQNAPGNVLADSGAFAL